MCAETARRPAIERVVAMAETTRRWLKQQVGSPSRKKFYIATTFEPRSKNRVHEALMGEDDHGWGRGGITRWCVREPAPRM
jgi:hypothetical protein